LERLLDILADDVAIIATLGRPTETPSGVARRFRSFIVERGELRDG